MEELRFVLCCNKNWKKKTTQKQTKKRYGSKINIQTLRHKVGQMLHLFSLLQIIYTQVKQCSFTFVNLMFSFWAISLSTSIRQYITKRKQYYRDNVPNKQKTKSIKFYNSYMPIQSSSPYGLEQ